MSENFCLIACAISSFSKSTGRVDTVEALGQTCSEMESSDGKLSDALRLMTGAHS